MIRATVSRILLIFVLLTPLFISAQGSTCEFITAFCADETDGSLIFPNCNENDPDCSPLGEPGPNYGCLYNTPYPAWFYLQIAEGGDLNFRIIQNTAFDANGTAIGAGLDVDFIAWGPFQEGDNLCDFSLLQPGNEVGCSYSAQPIENFAINNAIAGEIYVLVITNYSRQPGFIKLGQTGGEGSTDCSIVAQTGCEGEDFVCDASLPNATNYLWEYDDDTGFVEIYNGNIPVITVYDRGQYKATISFATEPDQIKKFTIETIPQPVIANEPNDIALCDDGSGVGIFNLTDNDDEVRGGQDITYPISYFRNRLDAGNNTNAIDPANAYPIVGNLETIWVRIQEGRGRCYALDSFEISFNSAFATAPASPYFLCDQDENGEELINLPALFNATVLNSQNPSLLSVTYHLSQSDANSGLNPLPAPYLITLSPTTIYVRVESNANTDCYSTASFDVQMDLPPAANTPEPFVVCDSNNDGFFSFDLHLMDQQITGGDPDLVVTYHGTFTDASNALNLLAEPYTNDNAYNDLVYARIESANSICYSIVELILEVRDSPMLADPVPYRLCESEGNGYAKFDLSSKDEEILNGQDPALYDLYYYVNRDDAIAAGEAALTVPDFSGAIGPGLYQNIVPYAQTLYVIGVGNAANTAPNNGAVGCYDLVELDLIVDKLPAVSQPGPYHLCDDMASGSTTDGFSIFDLTSRNAAITDGDRNLTVTWFESYQDELDDNAIVNPSAYQNREIPPFPATPQTVIARVSSPYDCIRLITLTLVVDPLPTPVTPSPLEVCDVDNDGFAVFNLTDKDQEIIGGDPSLTVSYHETLVDANEGTYPLADGYENIVAYTQTVFVRVAFTLPPNESGCFTVIALELRVVPSPVMPLDIPDMVKCDAQGNGTASFDLGLQNDFIYGGQDPSVLDLTYHTSLEDAEAGENAIPQSGDFTNDTNPQTIWVRLGAGSGLACFKIGQFDLIVEEGPEVFAPTPMEQCDDLGEPNDGIASFDLTQKKSEITGGVLTADVGFYITEQDALDNINRIDPDTDYRNQDANGNAINPQVLYVRVSDGNTACASHTRLTLRVLSNPEPKTPDPIVLCDANIVVGPGPDDGVEIFDLTGRAAQILDGENWELTYYESYANAVAQQGAIADPANYQNTAREQTIYVRATKLDTGCFEIVELGIAVAPLPDDSAEVSPYIICGFDTNGIGIFDLTTKIQEILGEQSPSDFAVEFYLRAADAATGTDPISNVTAHQNKDANNAPINPQTIFTRIIVRGDSGCAIGGVQSFELAVQEGAMATAPAGPFVICDNLGPSDGFASFDLGDFSNRAVVELRTEILSGQDPMGYALEFFETMERAMAGTDPITFPYVNTINPQIIYARVTNRDNIFEPKCHAIVEVILKVEELPEILLLEEYRLCVDENGNPIAEESGALSPPIIETGLDPTLFSFEWLLDGVFIPGQSASSIIALEQGEYSVVVTELSTGCTATAVTTVYLSSPPLVYDAVVSNGAFAGNHVISATAEGHGDYVFQLDNGPFQSSGIFENVDPGGHTITIRDSKGCGSVVIEVGVIDYPAFFTPNGDGYHDTWNIIGIATGDPMAKIYIFDRFGKLLKQLSPLGPGWDGTYSGNPLPSSDYWFRVEYTEDGNAKQFKGHFTLKR